MLEFDFVPETDQIRFDYVFGFFVDGENCAVVGDDVQPVSVNTINGEAHANHLDRAHPDPGPDRDRRAAARHRPHRGPRRLRAAMTTR